MIDARGQNRQERLGRIWRMSVKELREILRDRRTIITLVLMPLLLYPLLSIAFQQFFLSSLGKLQRPHYVIAFESNDDVESLVRFLNLGGLQLKFGDEAARGTFDASTIPVVTAYLVKDLEKGVRDFEVDVGMRLPAGTQIDFDPRHDLALDCELLFNKDSMTSRDALAYIEKHVTIANQKFLSERLKNLGVKQRAIPVRVERKSLEDGKTTRSGAVSVAAVIPFVLILMTITGAVYPAIDLTAGERERGTLEILVAAPIPRVGLLFAKYVAVVTVALLTATANLLTMSITILVSGVGRLLFGDSGLPLATIGAVFGLLLLFAAFFSAVLLALTSFARSFKEAQAYLIPLMLVSLAPGVLALTPNLELSGVLLITPLVNIVLLGRDLFEMRASAVAAMTVVASTLLYSFAAIACAARIFGAESVLYSTQSGWADLFQRPREVRRVPTVTSALLCLVLLFPADFLIKNLLAQFGDASLGLRLALIGLATALLFGLFPFVAAWLERVPVRAACSIQPAGALACAGAVLLGFSLWMFAYEIEIAMKGLGLFTMNEAVLKRMQSMIDQMRTLPPYIIVLALAVIPAAFEEFFFRGYLFNALRSASTPRATIFLSAFLFGLFHLIVTDSLAFERFVPSTLLGVVLGWLRWRSGSIFPGMLMHACHNGLLMMLAYYKEELEARGIGQSTDEYLPVSWLIGAGVIACLGALLVKSSTRPADESLQGA